MIFSTLLMDMFYTSVVNVLYAVYFKHHVLNRSAKFSFISLHRISNERNNHTILNSYVPSVFRDFSQTWSLSGFIMCLATSNINLNAKMTCAASHRTIKHCENRNFDSFQGFSTDEHHRSFCTLHHLKVYQLRMSMDFASKGLE